MKDHYNRTQTSGLGTKARPSSGRTTIVRTGHPALDAALAVDRTKKPDLLSMQAGCNRAATANAAFTAERSPAAAGVVGSQMSLTADRDGAGTTLHVGSSHAVVDIRGRARTISVWHELGTLGCN